MDRAQVAQMIEDYFQAKRDMCRLVQEVEKFKEGRSPEEVNRFRVDAILKTSRRSTRRRRLSHTAVD